MYTVLAKQIFRVQRLLQPWEAVAALLLLVFFVTPSRAESLMDALVAAYETSP